MRNRKMDYRAVQFLRRLYEQTGRDISKFVLISHIVQGLDFEKDLVNGVAQYLEDEGLITYVGFDLKTIRITRIGISEIEKLSVKKFLIRSEYDFWFMIHGSIIRVAKDKFEDGYYADAVESAFKEINKRVKEIVKDKTGDEIDGAGLMTTAFSLNKPIITLDDLSSQSGQDIQKGYMQIFAGAMTGIRNPKAYDNITISRERAIHFIFLASLLMHKLDEAKYKGPNQT